jgi:hypothetical protein
MPHPNALVIERLFAALNQHDATAMAACYREGKVIFHDIAFHFEEKPGIHDMWRMICEGESGIQATVKAIDATDRTGEARIVDTYQFGRDSRKGKKGRPVVNEITSRFRFRDGLIEEHIDDCDPRVWAQMALGGPLGWIAGRIRWLRAKSATRKLEAFLHEHPVPAVRPSSQMHGPR